MGLGAHMLTSSRFTLTDTVRSDVLLATQTSLSPAKLMHKIKHHTTTRRF